MSKAKLIVKEKVEFQDGTVAEVKLWEVPKTKEKPHGYKYSLVYIIEGKRVIGYDNSEGKRDHRHYGEHEEGYTFTTVRELIKDFFKDVNDYKKEEGKQYEG